MKSGGCGVSIGASRAVGSPYSVNPLSGFIIALTDLGYNRIIRFPGSNTVQRAFP